MNATVLDLRYKMNKVLSALENRETVNVLCHGKVRGIIKPVETKEMKASDHEFFGSDRRSTESVEETMRKLRGGRYNDL